ncbi:DUF262 domain-containing protein [Arthrobacter sedimenti]|uniref:DUF262 domain-containing protein n=1 Tax=Arthrobacter sedimenti TaxID=2694931 RepID=UPI00142268C0|nr:DUF262 domain-containing protein [Arthrobacter sedimenti]
MTEWFSVIHTGQIKLPRFQRHQAWDSRRIQSLLETVVRNLPLGVALVLRVSGKESFESRFLATAEPGSPAPTTMHLLDGQQRLTAFWRAMQDNYERETFFVHSPALDRSAEEDDVELSIRCQKTWRNREGLVMPRWIEDPAECYDRGLIPVRLLTPMDIDQEITEWTTRALSKLRPNPSGTVEERLAAFENLEPAKDAISSLISSLRSTVAHYNLPYLALPEDTPKEVALRVFINMNTNSKPLTMYDVVVAEVEDAAETSLHELVDQLRQEFPEVARYGELEELVLSTSALIQDKPPIIPGFLDIDKERMVADWPELKQCLARMAEFLQGEKVFDGKRLPIYAVLPVIAATFFYADKHGDKVGRDHRLLRRYLWSSFFSDRYGKTASTRSLIDFRSLRNLTSDPNSLGRDFTAKQLATVPVLDRSAHPLASVENLMSAGWPSKKESLSRAVLNASLYFGGRDFADDSLASFTTIQRREYHHLFPDKLLSDCGLPSSFALNCALITTSTNRTIGRKDPIRYLKDRVGWTTEEEINDRLRSHLVEFKLLSHRSYSTLSDSELRSAVEPDFRAFMRGRALAIRALVELLAAGEKPELHRVLPSLSADTSGSAGAIAS